MSDATQSGREMDARIGMELFGRKASRGIWCDSEGRYDPLPRYSESIADAFEVVERMREKGWTFEIIDFITKWKVYIENETELEIEEAESLPLAICRAALASLSALEGERK